MLKTIGFLFKKIKQYDVLMIPIMIIYTILSAINQMDTGMTQLKS
ncbi:hypothetical protein [Paratissierella segnis]|nr:hypothetical protein [Paratissierella segnis]